MFNWKDCSPATPPDEYQTKYVARVGGQLCPCMHFKYWNHNQFWIVADDYLIILQNLTQRWVRSSCSVNVLNECTVEGGNWRGGKQSFPRAPYLWLLRNWTEGVASQEPFISNPVF